MCATCSQAARLHSWEALLLILQQHALELLTSAVKLGRCVPQQRELPRAADDFKCYLAVVASALQAGRGPAVISDRLGGYAPAPLGVLYSLLHLPGALLLSWTDGLGMPGAA